MENLVKTKGLFTHERVRVYEKKTVNRAMHLMECPKCGDILASASERRFLPRFADCGGQENFVIPIKKQFS